VVAAGTPEDIAASKASHTGRFLKAHLQSASSNVAHRAIAVGKSNRAVGQR